MIARAAMVCRVPLTLLTVLPLLGGCKAIPEIAAVISGGVAGGATGNPAIGFGVGVAVDAAANAAVRYIGRSRQRAEQDAIAEAAGQLAPGGTAPWRIQHDIPIGNEHGELRVVRQIQSPLAVCKEIVFSVDAGAGPSATRSWYTASICRQSQGWKWASAEPAVERWGFLQ
jgi:hypothetical protein